MKSSTPSWMGLGSTDLPEQLSETAVIIAFVIYTILALAVYILIFLKLYLFFCQTASTSSKTKKRKTAKKNKSKAAAKSSSSSSASFDDVPASKKDSAKRKKIQSRGATKRKGMGGQMDVTLDKNGKKAVKTNQFNPYIFGIRIPDCTVS